ncbi:hypothetical protein, partial [Veronia pacifica]|uniref:hypothetical protein n=1 Tax=Veronia pacifica TaxID=1080227 RepID=UPI0015864E30
VSTVDDGVFEGDEDFTLTVATTIGDQSLTATGDATLDDAQDAPSTLTVGDAGTVNEGQDATFDVTLGTP